MKTLALIWALVVITGSGTAVYVGKSLDSLASIGVANTQVQPAESLDLGNSACLQACNEPQLQTAKGL